jgi:hypothetical protein
MWACKGRWIFEVNFLAIADGGRLFGLPYFLLRERGIVACAATRRLLI